MLGRENTGSALGSGAVDVAFWALVCEDEEWLDAEFDAIVSEGCETPARSTGRLRTDIARDRPPVRERRPAGNTWRWRTGYLPGRRWRRERGPPAAVRPAPR